MLVCLYFPEVCVFLWLTKNGTSRTKTLRSELHFLSTTRSHSLLLPWPCSSTISMSKLYFPSLTKYLPFFYLNFCLFYFLLSFCYFCFIYEKNLWCRLIDIDDVFVLIELLCLCWLGLCLPFSLSLSLPLSLSLCLPLCLSLSLSLRQS